MTMVGKRTFVAKWLRPIILVVLGSAGALAAEFFPIDTQPHGSPLPPMEAAGRIKVPHGFKVTLAASEPDVRQPIAIAYDDRGRLWVAECYSYDGSEFTENSNDRILILEDTNGDGVFDSRRVFADGLNRLTGLAVGFGGVWITAPPHVSFIPDRDGDDRPDGPPEIQLDGWTLNAEHNSVNGLTWGPDGWLYGRHGIKHQTLSRVGVPGTPDSERIELSSGIWRFHPTRRKFDLVADGTVNPWGLDFDEHGQAFISSSVVEHLWHVVPGARFERWKGRPHPYAYTYEMMGATSDHLHYGGGAWNQGGRLSRDNDELGGGHSHSDAMIYLGDRWPAEFRGTVFMSNIHGRRINRDVIVRSAGSGRFVGTHLPHFITVNDPWFRAVALKYGPDGDVVMTDWSDHGECHDRDGVHRTSGRIYKISWGEPRLVTVDLGALSVAELVSLQSHPNEWHVRHARRRLQELASAGVDMSEAHEALRKSFNEGGGTPKKLKSLWALHVTGGAEDGWLMSLLDDPDEHIRHWAVRLLADIAPPGTLAAPLARLAATEESWLVQMALASALQRLDPAGRLSLATTLLSGWVRESDPNLSRLLWYGLEPSVAVYPKEAIMLAQSSRVPRLRQFIARRLAEEMSQSEVASLMLDALRESRSPEVVLDLLTGSNLGLKARRRVDVPGGATGLQSHMRSGSPEIRRAAALLAATFGDVSALELLRRDLKDALLSAETRTLALEKLSDARPPWLLDVLLDLLPDHSIVESVLLALPAFDDERIGRAVISVFPSLKTPGAKAAAINALIVRTGSANTLLDAVASGLLERGSITLAHARQIAQLGDPGLSAKLDRVWGAVSRPAGGTQAAITQHRHALSPAVLADADLMRGSALFEQRCASCHALFGRGGSLGPDLTGSGRKDLDYLLLKILDPYSSISADYRLNAITLSDGRVISGSIASQSPRALIVRTASGEVVLARETVQHVEPLPMSLMPPGLLDGLSGPEIRDLFGYLMSEDPRNDADP